MCVTDRRDMTLAVKVALNPNTTSQQDEKKKWTGPSNECSSIRYPKRSLNDFFYKRCEKSQKRCLPHCFQKPSVFYGREKLGL